MSETQEYNFVLVTGATGFIGAHVVDTLLSRGFKVRGATRTTAKGEEMIKARPQYAGKLEFVQVDDFEQPGGLTEAVRGVDGVIHVASPFRYDVTDNEKELVLPAINGVKAIMEAASTNPTIKRIVITSSFASVLNVNRQTPPYFTYTAADWNPITYEEAVDPASTPQIAYRGSKKYAELEAWKYVKEHKTSFDIVTLCPPMVFGPVVHPVSNVDKLNESNAMLWKVVEGDKPLPPARVPHWVDGRDLAVAHVEALVRTAAGGKRFTINASERFSYGLAAEIINEEFPELRAQLNLEKQVVDESYGLDGETSAKELGFEYRSFRESVKDFVAQAVEISKN